MMLYNLVFCSSDAFLLLFTTQSTGSRTSESRGGKHEWTINRQEAESEWTGRAQQYLAADQEIGGTVGVGGDRENRLLKAAVRMLRHPGLKEALHELRSDTLVLQIKRRYKHDTRHRWQTLAWGPSSACNRIQIGAHENFYSIRSLSFHIFS